MREGVKHLAAEGLRGVRRWNGFAAAPEEAEAAWEPRLTKRKQAELRIKLGRRQRDRIGKLAVLANAVRATRTWRRTPLCRRRADVPTDKRRLGWCVAAAGADLGAAGKPTSDLTIERPLIRYAALGKGDALRILAILESARTTGGRWRSWTDDRLLVGVAEFGDFRRVEREAARARLSCLVGPELGVLLEHRRVVTNRY